MRAVILFRADSSLEQELHEASQFFKVIRLRTEVQEGDLVISRFASLPYPEELEKDIANLGGCLLNSARSHHYVADMEYLQDIGHLTFPTWFHAHEIPESIRNKPFIVKGKTNSYKWQWNTKMWAANWKEAVRLGADLSSDEFIGRQGVVYREYVPLETFEVGVNDLPFTNEWRVFIYKGHVVSFGYYWGCLDSLERAEAAKASFEQHGLKLAKQAYALMASHVDFVAIDVARATDGKWWVVEVNDGCQSGLNETINPTTFYFKLFQCLKDGLCE